jgi:indolepyruvate ferredoxin oxidoreductase beta subunit
MITQNILIVGVGGQGVVLASNLLSTAAMIQGYDVKKTDTLGMAQRGGSVVSHIRIAEQVFSPLIGKGQVDIIISFEKLEAVRWAPYLKFGGVAVLNDLKRCPTSTSLGKSVYPNDDTIGEVFRQITSTFNLIEASKLARRIHNEKVTNTVLLGYASRYLAISESNIFQAIKYIFPPKIQEINLKAFKQGQALTTRAVT